VTWMHCSPFSKALAYSSHRKGNMNVVGTVLGAWLHFSSVRSLPPFSFSCFLQEGYDA
jgi:hypothetical protein